MASAQSGEHGNGDQRVTNALIAHKIDTLTELLKEHISRDERVWETHGQRLSALEIGQTKREEQITTLRGEVEKLRTKSDSWNWINSILAIIAGIMARIGWNQ
jgi:hypothetical protein